MIIVRSLTFIPLCIFSSCLIVRPPTLSSAFVVTPHATRLVTPLAGGSNEEDEPGVMRVSEIKAELDLRKIEYEDCFDKDSLAQRLTEARATGKANPEILATFNKQNLEQQLKEEKLELTEKDVEAAMANDGTLPGGLTPDQFKKMAESPELMNLLKSTKMQEAMALMMTGGREQLESKLKEDPELQEIVQQLDAVLNKM